MKKTLSIIPLLIILFLLNITFSFTSSPLNRVRGSVVLDFIVPLDNDDGEWNHTYGGRYWDHGWCVQQTNDGGYIIAGDKSIDELNSAAWIIKTDAYGDKVWEKFFDASAAYVEEVQDGGYIVTGDCYLDPFDSDANIWFIRLDGNGNKVWERIFGNHRGSDVGYCVHQTSDGGYIIAGYTTSYSNTSDAYLIKTDRYGNMIWNKTFSSGCLAGSAYYVEGTRDGGYVLTGWNAEGLWVIRTNSSGDMLWERSFGESMDMGKYVHETSDGGFIVVGSTGLGPGSKNAWLIKLDSNGNMLWNHTFGGGASDWADFGGVTSDGGFVLVGGTESYKRYGDFDVWVIKTDSDGNKEWGRILGIPGKAGQGGHCIQQTSDDGFIIVGNTYSRAPLPGDQGESDIWLVKIIPDNSPPSKPIVTGPSSGRINRRFTINFSSVDPEGDDIYYFVVIWGVGTSGGWIGPYKSGETASYSFIPPVKGTFDITVKAMDEHGWDSLMSDPLRVTFPKPHWLNLLPPFIQRILLLY